MTTESVKATERSKIIMITTMRMMGGGGSVVNNNTANMVTIASALMDLSRGKEEEIKSREETVDKINDDGDLKPAAKPTDFILRHDKDSLNNNDDGGKGEDKELTVFSTLMIMTLILIKKGGVLLLVSMTQRWQ